VCERHVQRLAATVGGANARRSGPRTCCGAALLLSVVMQSSPRARRARPDISWPVATGLAVLVAYGWWFTDRLPFSGGALLAMFGAAAGLIVLGSVHRSSAQHHGRDEVTLRGPALRWSVIAWSATVTALTAWELLETAMENHSAAVRRLSVVAVARVGDCVVILAIGKVATQVGWGVIAAVLVAVVVVAWLSRGHFPAASRGCARGCATGSHGSWCSRAGCG
jgi:hypothetical protein